MITFTKKGLTMSISKELLSEVLGKEIVDFNMLSHPENRTILAYKPNSEKVGSIINIYELTHLCKEWAVKEGYALIEYPFAVELYNEKLVLRCCKITDKTTILYCPSRVFKACQWVLDNKETK